MAHTPSSVLQVSTDLTLTVSISNNSISLNSLANSQFKKLTPLSLTKNLFGNNISLNISFDLKRVFELENDPIPDMKEYTGWDECRELIELIDSSIEKDPRGEPGDGTIILAGFSSELDELRSHSSNAREFIAGLEREEIKRTNIKSLKVGYNKVFGYYIEIRNPHLEQVPEEYIRKQTLVGAERFITPKLKEYESLILSARERIFDLEKSLYLQICNQIGEKSVTLCKLADALAHIDVYTSLAEAAHRYNYVRPELNTTTTINITGGRHPVVERMVPSPPIAKIISAFFAKISNSTRYKLAYKYNNIINIIVLHYCNISPIMACFCKLLAQNWHKNFPSCVRVVVLLGGCLTVKN